MEGIDFTGLPQKNKSYGGANGSKLCVVYDNEDYMLKFPSASTKNDEMSYANGCISEYLADFASLKNKIIDSPRSGYGTELSDVQ